MFIDWQLLLVMKITSRTMEECNPIVQVISAGALLAALGRDVGTAHGGYQAVHYRTLRAFNG
jgi:hypothetical protein